MSSPKEHSAGIVLFKENNDYREYLILQYTAGHFDFPKGHIEGNESEKEAALRELTEETGIDTITFIDGYRHMIEYSFRHGGRLITKDVVFFLAKTEQENVTISHEHIDFVWLPYHEAYQRLTFPSARELLAKAEYLLQKKP